VFGLQARKLGQKLPPPKHISFPSASSESYQERHVRSNDRLGRAY
jgi:hypothetical protein